MFESQRIQCVDQDMGLGDHDIVCGCLALSPLYECENTMTISGWKIQLLVYNLQACNYFIGNADKCNHPRVQCGRMLLNKSHAYPRTQKTS